MKIGPLQRASHYASEHSILTEKQTTTHITSSSSADDAQFHLQKACINHEFAPRAALTKAIESRTQELQKHHEHEMGGMGM